jgi:penicillin-binding protein 1A
MAQPANSSRRCAFSDRLNTPRDATAVTDSPGTPQGIVGEQTAGRPGHGSVWRILGWLALLAVVVVVTPAAILLWALREIPSTKATDNALSPTIILESADGKPLARKGPVKIADVELDDFPKVLIDAVISIEDRRFYRHFGIDPLAILRALGRNVAAGEIVEGGSTISQQFVKMLLGAEDRTLARKLREAVVAIWMERQLGKDEILKRYLNSVYLGAGATGMPAAARMFFGKEVSKLTLPEAVLLAGLIKAPSQLSPLRNLEASRKRASVVLEAMVANGAIDAETAAKAKAEPATIKRSRLTPSAGTWFADWVSEEAAEIAGSFAGNIRVRTTLVPAIQDLAERVVKDALGDEGAAAGASQAALVVMRPDGAVLAMVGGRNYHGSEFNRAVQAKRQPGSAFKLFVYFAALRSGYSLNDRIVDAPLEVDGWQPENFGGRFRGRVTVADAFAQSLNAATARLALDVGIDQVIAAARALGIDAPLGRNPSIALGSSEVSLLDLTAAYAAVRAGWAPLEPWGIAGFGPEDQEQLFAPGPPAQPRRSLGQYRAPLLALLRRVVERGTGRAAALDDFAAGKTGTSQNYRDAWFIGFNDSLIVGVWIGNDDGTPMNEVTGGSLPARIWKTFMTEVKSPMPGAPLIVASLEPGQAELAGPSNDVSAPVQCNYDACAAAYRTFRASDCSYKPFRGGRRTCDKPIGGTEPGAVEGLDALVLGSETIDQPVIEPDANAIPVDASANHCDRQACSTAYRSFRASDCTYQPYTGGARRICDKGRLKLPDAPVLAWSNEGLPERAITGLFDFPRPRSCDFRFCAGAYRSFRASDCTYQPYDRGPRRLCRR